jgi:hypothetical protein
MDDLDTPVPELTSEELQLMEARFEKLDEGRKELRRKLHALDALLVEARMRLDILARGKRTPSTLRFNHDRARTLLRL